MISWRTHRRQGARAVTLAASVTTGLAVLAATAAWAAMLTHHPNRIRVSGPKANAYHTYFNETVFGHAAGGANYVISGEQLSKGSGCAAKYNVEKGRSDWSQWPTGTGSVHGYFSLVAQFWARNHGTHGICSYLIHQSTGKTFAHSGLFWTNS